MFAPPLGPARVLGEVGAEVLERRRGFLLNKAPRRSSSSARAPTGLLQVENCPGRLLRDGRLHRLVHAGGEIADEALRRRGGLAAE